MCFNTICGYADDVIPRIPADIHRRVAVRLGAVSQLAVAVIAPRVDRAVAHDCHRMCSRVTTCVDQHCIPHASVHRSGTSRVAAIPKLPVIVVPRLLHYRSTVVGMAAVRFR